MIKKIKKKSGINDSNAENKWHDLARNNEIASLYGVVKQKLNYKIEPVVVKTERSSKTDSTTSAVGLAKSKHSVI